MAGGSAAVAMASSSHAIWPLVGECNAIFLYIYWFRRLYYQQINIYARQFLTRDLLSITTWLNDIRIGDNQLSNKQGW